MNIKRSINASRVYYFANGYMYNWHNPHGPAYRSVDGRISYWQNGKQHNIVGPANNRGHEYIINGKWINRWTINDY